MKATISGNGNRRKLIFDIKICILRYVVINAFLVFVNWATCPYYWWVLWVIAGWGLGLFISLSSKYLAYRMNLEE